MKSDSARKERLPLIPRTGPPSKPFMEPNLRTHLCVRCGCGPEDQADIGPLKPLRDATTRCYESVLVAVGLSRLKPFVYGLFRRALLRPTGGTTLKRTPACVLDQWSVVHTGERNQSRTFQNVRL